MAGRFMDIMHMKCFVSLSIPGYGLPIHLIGQDHITKRINSLVEGEGAAVLIADLVTVVTQQLHPAWRHGGFPQANLVNFQSGKSA